MRGPTEVIDLRTAPTIALILLSVLPAAADAQPQTQPAPGTEAMAARLSADKVGDIQPGTYSAGDNLTFSLEAYGDRYLLHFADAPETFVLGMDRVALGGRELKYDTGGTALRVSVWGGMTLYTDSAPGGLPATRVGDYAPPPQAHVTATDLAQALRDETAHLAYTQKLNLKFLAAANSDRTRADAFDTLVNTDLAIDRLAASDPGRAALTRKLETVRLAEAQKPGVTLAGRTLTVRFVPSRGPLGRPSSHAIAAALGKYLSIPEGG